LPCHSSWKGKSKNKKKSKEKTTEEEDISVVFKYTEKLVIDPLSVKSIELRGGDLGLSVKKRG
jgi:hypothetical protein